MRTYGPRQLYPSPCRKFAGIFRQIVDNRRRKFPRGKAMRYLLALLIVCVSVIPSAAQDEKVAGKTVKEWSAAFKSTDARVRFKAVAALFEEGADAAPLVKELIPLLKDPQAAIRRGVAQTLGNCKAEAAPAVPALVAAMRDSDYWVRQHASNAL